VNNASFSHRKKTDPPKTGAFQKPMLCVKQNVCGHIVRRLSPQNPRSETRNIVFVFGDDNEVEIGVISHFIPRGRTENEDACR
jgi:hypothetical protein